MALAAAVQLMQAPSRVVTDLQGIAQRWAAGRPLLLDGCFPCGGVAKHLAADGGCRWITEIAKVKAHQQWRSLPEGSADRRDAEGNDLADLEATAALLTHEQPPRVLEWDTSSAVREAVGVVQLAAVLLPLWPRLKGRAELAEGATS
jgi:hypothetical protein